jgi:hypothetical protein
VEGAILSEVDHGLTQYPSGPSRQGAAMEEAGPESVTAPGFAP